jgi:hypothetical protein
MPENLFSKQSAEYWAHVLNDLNTLCEYKNEKQWNSKINGVKK